MKKLLQDNVSQDYWRTPLPNYLKYWVLLLSGYCSLKMLNRKFLSFKLPMILKGMLKACIILLFLVGIWTSLCLDYSTSYNLLPISHVSSHLRYRTDCHSINYTTPSLELKYSLLHLILCSKHKNKIWAIQGCEEKHTEQCFKVT